MRQSSVVFSLNLLFRIFLTDKYVSTAKRFSTFRVVWSKDFRFSVILSYYSYSHWTSISEVNIRQEPTQITWFLMISSSFPVPHFIYFIYSILNTLSLCNSCISSKLREGFPIQECLDLVFTI